MHKYELRKYLVVTGTLLSIFAFFYPTSTRAVSLHSGDIIFLNLDCGDMCDAIEKATEKQFGKKDTPLSHVGILFEEKDAHGNSVWMVYEAMEKVQKISMEKFLKRVDHDPERWFVKRRKFGMGWFSGKKKLELKAFLDSKLGMEYDDVFEKDNGKYYCSELVADAYNSIFPKAPFRYLPMTFGDANDPKDYYHTVWEPYFKEKGLEVPQGNLGISPLGIFLSTDLLESVLPCCEDAVGPMPFPNL